MAGPHPAGPDPAGPYAEDPYASTPYAEPAGYPGPQAAYPEREHRRPSYEQRTEYRPTGAAAEPAGHYAEYPAETGEHLPYDPRQAAAAGSSTGYPSGSGRSRRSDPQRDYPRPDPDPLGDDRLGYPGHGYREVEVPRDQPGHPTAGPEPRHGGPYEWGLGGYDREQSPDLWSSRRAPDHRWRDQNEWADQLGWAGRDNRGDQAGRGDLGGRDTGGWAAHGPGDSWSDGYQSDDPRLGDYRTEPPARPGYGPDTGVPEPEALRSWPSTGSHAGPMSAPGDQYAAGPRAEYPAEYPGAHPGADSSTYPDAYPEAYPGTYQDDRPTYPPSPGQHGQHGQHGHRSWPADSEIEPEPSEQAGRRVPRHGGPAGRRRKR